MVSGVTESSELAQHINRSHRLADAIFHFAPAPTSRLKHVPLAHLAPLDRAPQVLVLAIRGACPREQGWGQGLELVMELALKLVLKVGAKLLLGWS